MYKVVISPSANADLFNALKYIAYELENPQAATSLADGVEKCYEALGVFPAAHELCRDSALARMGYRRYNDEGFFRMVRVGDGTLVWPDNIDIGPEDVWESAQRY